MPKFEKKSVAKRLNVVQKLDHCFTIRNIFFPPVVLQCVSDSVISNIFKDTGAFGKQIDGGKLSVSPLCHISEDFESTLQSLLEAEQKCLSRERICHVKNVFSITVCREQGNALSVHLVS